MCGRCDRGQRYCASGCAGEARREGGREVVAIEGESYRLKEAKERDAQRAKKRREKASAG